MSYVNLPVNLQDMFYTLSDRVTKLETGPSGPQDTADAANVAATAASATAVAAQTTANGAQTTANGKNTVYYNTYNPTSQANTAGDLWFTYTTGGVVTAQWTGQGGTSWTQNTLANTVIANLDAGKITTGILDATLVTVTTSPTATNSITFSGANTSIDFKVGGSPRAHIVPLSSYGVLMHYGTYADPNGSTYPQVYVGSSNASMGASSTYLFSSSTTGNTISGGVTINGIANAFGNRTGTSSAANCYFNSTSGFWTYSTASSERYKNSIVDLDTVPDLASSLILKLRPRAFKYNDDYLLSTDQRYEQLIPGFISEEIQTVLPIAVDIQDGQIETWNERMLIPGMVALIQQINNRLTALEAK